MLQHVIDEANNAGAKPIVVITGANAEKISASIDTAKINLLYNDKWKDGMASGIVAGVRRVLSLNSAIKKIIIAVCDQPFVSATLFKQLDQSQTISGKGIVASTYADTIGTPALFTSKYFDQLMKLKGDEGAKKILKSNKEDVETVGFSKGEIDIDTQTDYENLLNEQELP